MCAAASTGPGRITNPLQGGLGPPQDVGHSPTYGVPRPLGAAEHHRQKTDQREDCLTERSEGVPQRPFSAEERREVGAKRRPSRGVPFLLPSFLWASKEKKGWRAEPSASKTSARQREQGWVCSAEHLPLQGNISSATGNTESPSTAPPSRLTQRSVWSCRAR